MMTCFKPLLFDLGLDLYAGVSNIYKLPHVTI